jgi:release factor glutamine methyltransferase
VSSIGALLKEAKRLLARAPFSPSPREAHLLLGRVLGLSEAGLLARDELAVGRAEETAFRALLARRLTGEPMAYVLGEREFYGRVFAVDPRVLVPRPETEHLVEAVLELELPRAARGLDVGVGSGAVAVTLALERPGWRLTGSDLSPGALAVARANARRMGAEVHLVAADLLAGFDLSGFDFVVSNPPYIAREEAHALSPEITRFEPASALYGSPAAGAGDGGTALVAGLMRQAEGLPPGTPLALEIGAAQMPAVRALAAAGAWSVRRVVRDYAGFERVVVLMRG